MGMLYICSITISFCTSPHKLAIDIIYFIFSVGPKYLWVSFMHLLILFFFSSEAAQKLAILLSILSHPILEGKPDANHVRARIRTHVHSDYIIGYHHATLKINSRKVL
jgi:hypothetical protein